MRIGNVTSRINGLSVGVGSLGYTTDLAGIVSSYANSFMYGIGPAVEQGTAVPPSVVLETLTSAVANACADAVPGSPCDPSSVQPQINQAVAAYAVALSAKQSTFAQQVAAGQVTIPGGSSYVQPPPPPPPPVAPPASSSQVQYSSQPSNALDRVTPQVSSVLPAPVSNALAPPTTPAPVSATNAGSFTGTSTTSSGPGVLSGTVALGGMNIPTWALLGVAALGLFMMVKGKGK